jgi:hypothetical protein
MEDERKTEIATQLANLQIAAEIIKEELNMLEEEGVKG